MSGDIDELGQDDVTEQPEAPNDELLGPNGPATDGGAYGLIVLDTNDTMNTTRPSTGNTRCEDSKTMARGMIYDFFGAGGVAMAVWGFHNNPQTDDDVQPVISDYYFDAVSAVDALDSLAPCGGQGPLADALCKGTNGDGETFTLDPMLTQLFILTDGTENSSDGPCSGPSGGHNTLGTWQYNVLLEMASTGVRVDARYWDNPQYLLMEESIDSLAFGGPSEAPPAEPNGLVADGQGVQQGMFEPMPMCDDSCKTLKTLRQAAVDSDGTWGLVADDDETQPVEGTTDPPGGPVMPELAGDEVGTDLEGT